MFTMRTTSETVQDCKACTVRRLSQTFSFVALFVILSDISHDLQPRTISDVVRIINIAPQNSVRNSNHVQLCYDGSMFHNPIRHSYDD